MLSSTYPHLLDHMEEMEGGGGGVQGETEKKLYERTNLNERKKIHVEKT